MTTVKRVGVHVRLLPIEQQAVRLFAQLYGKSYSEIVSLAVQEWIAQQEFQLDQSIESGKLSDGEVVQAGALKNIIRLVPVKHDGKEIGKVEVKEIGQGEVAIKGKIVGASMVGGKVRPHLEIDGPPSAAC